MATGIFHKLRGGLEAIRQDVGFALRTFKTNPGFTLVAVVTLALGIGANTAIFSVIDGVLLHPIPFPDGDRLVVMYQKTATSDKNSVSYPNLLDWQQDSQTFEAIAGWRNELFTLTGRGRAEQLTGMMVTADFFSVLRVQPLKGRMFLPEEDRRGSRPVALLGEEFWRRRFASDPNLIGQDLMLDGRSFAVIGIVPANVRLERANNAFLNDVFVPIGQNEDPLFYKRGVGNGTLAMGRLKTGVTLEQASAEMNTITANLAAAYPDDDAKTGATLIPFKQFVLGDLEPTLLALGAAVGFVLLIACTNVANLTLARSTGRSREFAVRRALGAGRGRLIRQILTESALLSIIGGGIGVLIAAWSTGLALQVLPSVLPAISHVGINVRVLLFSFSLALLSGIAFGLIPALKAGGLSLQESLKEGGRGAIRGRHRAQHVLIVCEVALTLMLMVGAGLMIRSLRELWNVSPGFDPQGVLTFYTGLSPQRASSPESIRGALREIDDRLGALSGVSSASVEIGGLPFLGNTTLGFQSEDDPQTSRVREMRTANLYAVGPDHFKTMGIPLLRGRSFTRGDTAGSPLVVVVDEELARTVFPGQEPIGKHLYLHLYSPEEAVEIIGIAGHVKHSGLDSDATAKERMQFYTPYMQLPDAFLPLAANAIAGIVRSGLPRTSLVSAIKKELAAFDGDRAIHSEQSMTDVIAGSLAKRRFSLIVLGSFAATALILSIIGIYGVVSYFVNQRSSEIGLRMALGAQSRDIFYDILGEGGKLGAIGIVIGAAGAAALTRLMAGMLFGISPTDPLTFAAAAMLLLALTLLACYLPARRAMSIAPMAALRNE